MTDAGRFTTQADQMLSIAGSRRESLALPEMSSKPRLRVAILTCMDVRIEPHALLGLKRGDAHVIRNAGGLVTDDAIRSLSVSQRKLGTEEVVVMMHDLCGLHGASDEDYARELAQDGASPTWRLGGFEDVELALRNGLACLRASRELPVRGRIRGFVFDPATGSVRDVETR